MVVLRRNFPVDKMGGASYHVRSLPPPFAAVASAVAFALLDFLLPWLPPSLTELGAQVLWNMFKKLCAARGSSDEEKAALFYGTAARVYKLGESAAL